MPFKDKAAYREYMRLYMKTKRSEIPSYGRGTGHTFQPTRPKTDVCELCGETGVTVYDHDHTTGIFRGWICYRCNIGLGAFKDTVGGLLNALRYLAGTLNQAMVKPIAIIKPNGVKPVANLDPAWLDPSLSIDSVLVNKLEDTREERGEGESEGEPRQQTFGGVLPEWYTDLWALPGFKETVEHCQEWFNRNNITEEQANKAAAALRGKWPGPKTSPYRQVWPTFRNWAKNERDGKVGSNGRVPASQGGGSKQPADRIVGWNRTRTN